MEHRCDTPRDFERLVEEAGVFSMLSEYYFHNPDENLVLSSRKLDPEAAGDEEMREAFAKIRNYAERCGLGEDHEEFLDLKRDWTKLFRAVSPDYGPRAPYGLLWIEGDIGRLMATLAGIYLEGGYDGFRASADRIDYIGTGFQFLSSLALQMAQAVKTGDDAELERLARCRSKFLHGFFRPWVTKYCEATKNSAATAFYAGVIELTGIAMKRSL